MTPRDVGEKYWRIECTREVAAIVTCYAEDAELVVPGLGRLVGHDEIRRLHQASVDRFPSLQVDIVGATHLGDAGAFAFHAPPGIPLRRRCAWPRPMRLSPSPVPGRKPRSLWRMSLMAI